MKKHDLSIHDMQKKFGISNKTVRNWIRDRGMPHRKIGNVIRFNEEEVDQWVDEQQEKREV